MKNKSHEKQLQFIFLKDLQLTRAQLWIRSEMFYDVSSGGKINRKTTYSSEVHAVGTVFIKVRWL